MKAQTETFTSLTPDEAKEIARDAWLFGMPLVYIEIQLDTTTHVSRVENGKAPINQFVHYREFPDASNKTVVGFNVDTLYSLAQMKLAEEPMILSVPEMGKRFWVMQLIDGWNNVPAAPGSRTVGSKGGSFAIVGPDWNGKIPDGVTELRIPTNIVTLAGRTYTGGPDDYGAVHAIQDQYKLVPLSQWGKDYTPPTDVPLKEGVDTKTPVPMQVLAMTPENFFNNLNRLLVTNPPEPADPETMERVAKLGLGPGETFSIDAFTPEVRTAIEEGVAEAITEMKNTVRGKVVNGWQIALDLGRYGKRYAYRAGWTFYGVGGNLSEDAVYPFAEKDVQGNPFNGASNYTLTFKKEEIPPVNAFWSLTLYDKDAFLSDNPINRYALGDRSGMKSDAQGSLTIYIQNESPGKDKESNWLPAPKDEFKLALRLYAPKKEVADALGPAGGKAGELERIRGRNANGATKIEAQTPTSTAAKIVQL